LSAVHGFLRTHPACVGKESDLPLFLSILLVFSPIRMHSFLEVRSRTTMLVFPPLFSMLRRRGIPRPRDSVRAVFPPFSFAAAVSDFSLRSFLTPPARDLFFADSFFSSVWGSPFPCLRKLLSALPAILDSLLPLSLGYSLLGVNSVCDYLPVARASFRGVRHPHLLLVSLRIRLCAVCGYPDDRSGGTRLTFFRWVMRELLLDVGYASL